MTELDLILTRQSTRPSVLLPFHLVWFGRLSKRQGSIAIQRRLIVKNSEKGSTLSGQTVRLTKRGQRQLEPILISKKTDAPSLFAYLLQRDGHVTDEPFYIYADTPLALSWGYSHPICDGVQLNT
jgi:hypothetical protein